MSRCVCPYRPKAQKYALVMSSTRPLFSAILLVIEGSAEPHLGQRAFAHSLGALEHLARGHLLRPIVQDASHICKSFARKGLPCTFNPQAQGPTCHLMNLRKPPLKGDSRRRCHCHLQPAATMWHAPQTKPPSLQSFDSSIHSVIMSF